ncbi:MULTISPECIES: glycoside hydrolase family 19 protein [unclassified Paraburkholderia]|uniref:glycoside hydrolase family 19 protein n=1 Tax=unclassified Paraburkholderia TaxID=2615204 RepID=UPI00160DDAEF|nr:MULTISPECIES: glycoside hydrolase family 19 protein [unclassified Paraburkholderia]MBB5444671.1 putative chitinase [Paraburkholderia sp. WSM4177]MBB5485496.1 putative chitinase [Paraburkholderia sp. WSM4180]
MNLNAQIIAAGCGATVLRASQWVTPLQAACDRFTLDTGMRAAAFFANVGVESARLITVAENLNYSADGLLATFPSHFTEAEAQAYAHQPPRIANRAYADRNGNGGEASGDGWTFRGRGLLQVSGRRNYQLCGLGIGLDLVNHPELLEEPANAALAAGWYWASRKLNTYADGGLFLQVCKTINLGSAGAPGVPGSYSQRLALYGAAKKALGIA